MIHLFRNCFSSGNISISVHRNVRRGVNGASALLKCASNKGLITNNSIPSVPIKKGFQYNGFVFCQLERPLPAKRLFTTWTWTRKMTSIPLKFNKYGQCFLLRTITDNAGHAYYVKQRNKSVILYLASVAVLTVGLSYAAVPLYRMFCQATGYGGTTKQIDSGAEVENLKVVDDRTLTIRFEAGTSRNLQWKFKPVQREVTLCPGDTALAFYTAENLTDRPIIGISTYNVLPFDAGKYFNKIQCFCFEEQQLNPHEEVDMPVFFYIDPDFDEDPQMHKINEIILSYTFFESSEGQVPTGLGHGK